MPPSTTPSQPQQPVPHKVPDSEAREAFLRRLMANQLRLSVSCGSAFFVVLLALPMINYTMPDLMATRVFGFTLTWLILGVLIYPAVWVISFLFIRLSIAMEEEESHWKLPE